MKKTLLIVLLIAATTLPAAAQVFVSGNVAFNRSDYKRSQGFDNTMPQGMAAEFAPQVGFCLGEKIKAGIRANVSYSQYTYTNGYYDRDNSLWVPSLTDEKTLLTLGGGVFMRFRLVETGQLSFHLEISGGYSYGIGDSKVVEERATESIPIKTRYDYTINSLEVKMVPVMSVALSQHSGIDVYADLLSLAYRRDSETHMLPIDMLETSRSAGVDYTLTMSGIEAAIRSQKAKLLTIGFYYQF